MDDYEELVEKCRKNRTQKRIENASISHARVLFKNLFAAALTIPDGEPKRMLIQCGSALPSFYDNFVDDVLAVMTHGVDVWAILADSSVDVSENRFLCALKGNDRGHIGVLPSPEFANIHFVVVGSSAYRIETDTSNIQAFANFNEGVLADFASDVFKRNWELTGANETLAA